MGQTLSFPATLKHSKSGGNGRFLFGVSEMQGWRVTMEDAHAVILDLDGEKEDSNTFFAVYDGHGGSTVAKFAGHNVHKRLLAEEAYRNQQYEDAMKRAFLGTDEDLLADPAHTRETSGCTAVAALVTTSGKIYVANAGDSRSVLGVKGEAKPLSFDHKPTNEAEKERIRHAGGYVEYGRVNGNLALTRALGDFEFKKNYTLIPQKQIITADPDVTCHEITEDDEFIVLACDGIWDCLSSQEVIDFVRYQVSEGKELAEICEMLCELCLAPDTTSGAGTGCDNMTVLVIAILHGRTKEEWYAWITDRIKKGYGYKTPGIIPSLYPPSRLLAFRARRDAQGARDRARQNHPDDNNGVGFLGGAGLGGFARVLGGTGGITFHSINDSGSLMFGSDDIDEDDSGDEDSVGARSLSFFSDTLGLGRSESPDPTKHLRAQLDEYEKDIRQEDGAEEHGESDINQTGGDKPDDRQSQHSDGSGGASAFDLRTPFLKTLPNGKPKATPTQQLKSQPLGDEPASVVTAEGFLDSSEDTLKA